MKARRHWWRWRRRRWWLVVQWFDVIGVAIKIHRMEDRLWQKRRWCWPVAHRNTWRLRSAPPYPCPQRARSNCRCSLPAVDSRMSSTQPWRTTPDTLHRHRHTLYNAHAVPLADS
jgi:hypothetical protein